MDRRDLRQLAAETAWIADSQGYEQDGVAVRLPRPKMRSLPPTRLPPPAGPPACLEVTCETTLAAARRHAGRAPLCLVFASGRKPGGGFLNGAAAQEEAVVRGTNVWPALAAAAADPFYGGHAPIYTDHALWASPVAVIRDDAGGLLPAAAVTEAGLLFVAAPNVRNGCGLKSCDARHRRAGLIFAHARAVDASVLVLGGWGCGVFGNDPEAVAASFRHWIDAGQAGGMQVVFAMGSAGRNEQAFRRVFVGGEPLLPPGLVAPDEVDACAARLDAAREAHRRSGAAKPGWRVREAQAALDRALARRRRGGRE